MLLRFFEGQTNYRLVFKYDLLFCMNEMTYKTLFSSFFFPSFSNAIPLETHIYTCTNDKKPKRTYDYILLLSFFFFFVHEVRITSLDSVCKQRTKYGEHYILWKIFSLLEHFRKTRRLWVVKHFPSCLPTHVYLQSTIPLINRKLLSVQYDIHFKWKTIRITESTYLIKTWRRKFSPLPAHKCNYFGWYKLLNHPVIRTDEKSSFRCIIIFFFGIDEYIIQENYGMYAYENKRTSDGIDDEKRYRTYIIFIASN